MEKSSNSNVNRDEGVEVALLNRSGYEIQLVPMEGSGSKFFCASLLVARMY